MATFPGGSAYAMVRDIADGHLLMTERHLQRMEPSDLEQLRFELDRHMREIRGDQPSLEDLPAVQSRNRRIQRLNTARLILRNVRQRKR